MFKYFKHGSFKLSLKFLQLLAHLCALLGGWHTSWYPWRLAHLLTPLGGLAYLHTPLPGLVLEVYSLPLATPCKGQVCLWADSECSLTVGDTLEKSHFILF